MSMVNHRDIPLQPFLGGTTYQTLVGTTRARHRIVYRMVDIHEA